MPWLATLRKSQMPSVPSWCQRPAVQPLGFLVMIQCYCDRQAFSIFPYCAEYNALFTFHTCHPLLQTHPSITGASFHVLNSCDLFLHLHNLDTVMRNDLFYFFGISNAVNYALWNQMSTTASGFAQCKNPSQACLNCCGASRVIAAIYWLLNAPQSYSAGKTKFTCERFNRHFFILWFNSNCIE